MKFSSRNRWKFYIWSVWCLSSGNGVCNSSSMLMKLLFKGRRTLRIWCRMVPKISFQKWKALLGSYVNACVHSKKAKFLTKPESGSFGRTRAEIFLVKPERFSKTWVNWWNQAPFGNTRVNHRACSTNLSWELG